MTGDRTHERTSIRAPVALTPRYRSPSSFEFVEGRCTDLSDGGMFMAAELPCELGTLIKFECSLGQSADLLKGVGRVVWRRSNGDAAHPSGMGLKFVKVEPGGQEMIAAMIAAAEAKGMSAPQQPLAAQVRETDSYRPEQETVAAAPAEVAATPSMPEPAPALVSTTRSESHDGGPAVWIALVVGAALLLWFVLH